MKYEITIRRLNETEIKKKACFLAKVDEKTYLRRVSSFVEEINDDISIQSARVVANVITVESSLSKEDIQEKLKPYFSGYLCDLRFSGIK